MNDTYLAHFARPIFIPSDANGGQQPTMMMGPDNKPVPNQTSVLACTITSRDHGRIVLSSKLSDSLTLTIDMPEDQVTLVRGVESRIAQVNTPGRIIV